MQSLIKNPAGKKILMAISGQILILFIVIHVAGNSSLYSGGLNAYAERLHSLPVLMWMSRMVMFTMFSVHVVFGITSYLENRSTRPRGYAVKKDLSATFAGKTMIWSGLLIGFFLIYHLLHFTVQITNPDLAAKLHTDTMGRPDVYRMVVLSFRQLFISTIYVLAMTALALHLVHGIQSSFQTLGLSGEQSLPIIRKTGSTAAFIIFLGYVSIPIIIFFGLKG